MRGGAAPRIALLATTVALLGLGLPACGGGDGDEVDTAAQEREADAEILNQVLSRQLAAAEAYERALPALNGGARTLAAEFHRQEQQHVDAILEALRALEAAEEPESEEIEEGELRGEAERLRFLYEVESATIEDLLGAISRLSSPSARSLLAAIAANHAQHLVLLRRALGAIPLEWVPSAFEAGASPAP
jgi:hypothetical protein